MQVKVGLIITEDVFDDTLDWKIDDAFWNLFGEESESLAQTDPDELKDAIDRLKEIGSYINKHSQGARFDNSFLELERDLLQDEVDFINKSYTAYMKAIDDLNSDVTYGRDKLTETGRKLAPELWSKVQKINQTLMLDGETNSLMKHATETAVWACKEDFIPCFVALLKFYQPYYVAQLKGIFLINALFRDPSLPGEDDVKRIEIATENVQNQMHWFMGSECMSYRWKLAARILSNPAKDVPIQFTAPTPDKFTLLKPVNNVVTHEVPSSSQWIVKSNISYESEVFYMESVDIRSKNDIIDLKKEYNFRFRHKSGRYLVCEQSQTNTNLMNGVVIGGMFNGSSNALVLADGSSGRKGT